MLPLSLAVNEKLGEVLLLGSLGLPMIVAVGATVSIVQVDVSSALGLPAGSVALTTKVCDPSARPG